MDLFEKLNPMQREAVKYTEGSLLILAGAGSGKTRVLTHRMAYLIMNGVKAFNILAITFTNKAAKEMRERANAICPEGEEIWVSTFHSLCVRILRREITHINMNGNFSIYDSDETERIIKKCIKELNVNDKLFPAKAIISQISSWKNELLTPDNVYRESANNFRLAKIAEIYQVYQKKLKECNALDFDDIIFKAVELFVMQPPILQKYQERFKYIMVDEYQDTNTSQYTLVKLLSAKYKNICVVGDDDQSIYGWRGANIRNILEFESDYKDTKVIKLEQNYRSTKNILTSANKVINNNIHRKNKQLWTDNDHGSLIKYYRAISDLDESAYVADTVQNAVASGAKYSDFAVLYRVNAMSRVLEDHFVRGAIPYRLLGGVRFYERREVKDILSYLKFIHNTLDEMCFLRIINVPKRGIGDSSVDKVVTFANENEIPIFEALKELENIEGLGNRTKKLGEFRDLMLKFVNYSSTHSVRELIEYVLVETKYLNELELEGTEEARSRIENVNELVTKAVQFEKENENPNLAAFLEDVALVADVDNYNESDDAVVMMTLHSSKGLEFPSVFITGFEEGVFPSYRSLVSGDLNDLEEERRLCYVGITRAKESLYICSASSRMQNGQTNYNAPSRFLKEVPEECIQYITSGISNTKPATNPERSGVSKFAEINKTKNAIDISFGGKNYINSALPVPKNLQLDFEVGDTVRQMKYGVGVVKDIKPAGADYEVTVEFLTSGVKKFMAHLSKLKKFEG